MATKPVIKSNITDIGKVDLNININLPQNYKNQNVGSNYAILHRTLKLTPKMKRNNHLRTVTNTYQPNAVIDGGLDEQTFGVVDNKNGGKKSAKRKHHSRNKTN